MTTTEAGKWRAVEPGSGFTVWAATAPDELYFPGTARPTPDRVDYRFRNGWVDTGDLPCREALRTMLPTRVIACPDGPFSQLAIANDGDELDFSAFLHRPTLISRAFRCLVRCQGSAPARLRIATCGGVRIWLGGVSVAVFEPFDRNHPHHTDVTIDIPTEAAELTLRLEDLHERDTTNFFSLTLLDGPPIETCLPPGSFDIAAEEAVELLNKVRIDGVFHEAGPVRFRTDHKPNTDWTLGVEGPAQFTRGGISQEPGPPRRTSITLGPSQGADTLFEVEDAPNGCVGLTISAGPPQGQIVRALGTTVLKPGIALGETFEARRARAADEIARHAGFEPPVAALLALRGEQPDRVAAILSETLTTIEERHDCSDFNILPLLRLWRDGQGGLSPALRDRMRAAFLGYRYWMSEPGNDVMWFWSENHVLCFHTAQAVAGQLFPDETFTNSGRTGREHAADALARLNRWFDSIEEHGLCEWNSAAYYPIDMLGLFTLHDMVPEVKARAARLLDRIFTMVALHTSGDVPAGSQGRCYEKELLAGTATELGSVAAIAFGAPFVPGYDRAAALFCLSDYVPPQGLDQLRRPGEGTWLDARYTQGLGHVGKLSLWKSPDIQMSTAATEAVAGEKGHQAHVVDIQAAAHPMARLWINHPGELKEWGDRRPSLLAGNHVMPHVVQHANTAVLLYDIDRPWTHIGFTQLFAVKKAFAPPVREGSWWIFEAGRGCVAVWCSAELASVGGTYEGALWRAHAPRVAWVVTVAMPAETNAAFRQRLTRTAPHFDAAQMTLHSRLPKGDSLLVTFGKPSRVNGEPTPFAPLSSAPHVGWNGNAPNPWSPHAARP